MVISILQNSPQDYLDLSDVGSKLQTISGHSWNTKFKKRYGALVSFIQNQKGIVFDSENNHVYLEDRWEKVKAQQEEKKQKKAAKKARREGKENPATTQTKSSISSDGKAQGHGNHSNSSAHAPKPQSAKKETSIGGVLCFSLVLALILFIFFLSLWVFFNYDYVKSLKLEKKSRQIYQKFSKKFL